ncbi:MAG TPA: hypothetical protein PKX07_12565 [Aggregatilineales bacterium]|nr:hypothetical protein [Aggregatilineales bacterium]
MKNRLILLIALVVIVVLAVVIVVASTALTPSALTPAYAVAVDFTNAAIKGDEPTAAPLVDFNLTSFAADNCPDGRVSACIQGYAPEAWGGLISAVFRRSIPDGADAWDIQLVATYEQDKGFSGVCIYNRVERFPALASANDRYEGWRVTRWSGFVPCDDARSGIQQLRTADAPNRAP